MKGKSSMDVERPGDMGQPEIIPCRNAPQPNGNATENRDHDILAWVRESHPRTHP
jgi:hypothetical protein